MPLNPSPVIDTNLCLITIGLLRSDMSRAALVTFSTDCTGTPSGTLAQTVVDSVAADFKSAWQGVFDSEVAVQPAQIRLGDGSNVPYEAVTSLAVYNGTNAGTFAPPNVALLLKKRTALGGKKNRGRTYMPFVLAAADINENGTLIGGAQASFSTVSNGFASALSSHSHAMVISHKIFNVPLAPHYVTHIQAGPLVTDYSAEGVIATQRRRLDR